MRPVRKLVAAPLIALLGLGTMSPPAQAQVMDVEVMSDGYGTVADRFVIRVNASSVRITTSVSSYGEVTEEECSFEDEDALCEETYTVRLRVWNPKGTRIVSALRDSEWGYDDFEYAVGLPGRYKTAATVTQYVDGVKVDEQTATGYYQVFKQKRSRLPINRSRINRGAYKWKLVGDLSVVDAPPRYDRGQRVELWARVDGYWFAIDSSRTTRKGKVGWIFKPNRYTWSMCYDGTADRRVRGTCGGNYRTPRPSGRALRSFESVADARAAIG